MVPVKGHHYPQLIHSLFLLGNCPIETVQVPSIAPVTATFDNPLNIAIEIEEMLLREDKKKKKKKKQANGSTIIAVFLRLELPSVPLFSNLSSESPIHLLLQENSNLI